jgi:hypothetical protein
MSGQHVADLGVVVALFDVTPCPRHAHDTLKRLKVSVVLMASTSDNYTDERTGILY